MLELGENLVNKSDMRMRPLGENDFFEFRKASIESKENNSPYLIYGFLFENLNVMESAKIYKAFLDDGHYEHWGIFHRKQLIGHIGFSSGSSPFSAEILGWVRKGHESQGIGEIGLQTACTIAFQYKSFNYVELRIKESNAASRGVAEKVGFVPVLKLGSNIVGGIEPCLLYLKINPEIVNIARIHKLRPIDIMNNPASQPPLRYLLRNKGVFDFYSWPFRMYTEESNEVDFVEYHDYMALLSLTPDDLEKMVTASRVALD